MRDIQFLYRRCRAPEAEESLMRLFEKFRPHTARDMVRFAFENEGALLTAETSDGEVVGFFLFGPKAFQPCPEPFATARPCCIIFMGIHEQYRTSSLLISNLFRAFLDIQKRAGSDYRLFCVNAANLNAMKNYEELVATDLATRIKAEEGRIYYAASVDTLWQHFMRRSPRQRLFQPDAAPAI